MSPEAIVALVGGILAVAGFSVLLAKKLPKKIKRAHFTRKWRDIQRLCSSKEYWPEAILGADNLLDDVLKKRRKSGKSMGERMVAAQKQFTNNDAIWQAHKLANKLMQEEPIKLKEQQVKDSLVAYRQALRDLGAL